jgi:hypothetical protein
VSIYLTTKRITSVDNSVSTTTNNIFNLFIFEKWNQLWCGGINFGVVVGFSKSQSPIIIVPESINPIFYLFNKIRITCGNDGERITASYMLNIFIFEKWNQFRFGDRIGGISKAQLPINIVPESINSSVY